MPPIRRQRAMFFHNLGEFDVPFLTENRHAKSVRFNHARVSMPILSMDRWNNRGRRTTLDETDCDPFTVHKETGEIDPVINREGVYFMKIVVNRRLLNRPSGFTRPGA